MNHIAAFRAVASMIMPRIKAILSDFMESRPFLYQVDDLTGGEGPCTPHENDKVTFNDPIMTVVILLFPILMAIVHAVE